MLQQLEDLADFHNARIAGGLKVLDAGGAAVLGGGGEERVPFDA